MHNLHRSSVALLAGVLLLGACDGSPNQPEPGFLAGTRDNPEIGLVINSTEQALTVFQLGDPAQQRQVPFGANQLISPTGMAVRGTRAIVPLGNAASVALVDLELQRIDRFFIFPSGNATGSTWVNDTTVLVANLNDHYVGRFTLGQTGNTITQKSPTLVTGPTHIDVVGNRALVVSSNYDMTNFRARQGTVTALDPTTLQVLGSVQVGINPTYAAVGPDGMLYVLNTGDYVAPSTITVLNPATLAIVATEERLAPGSIGLSIDAAGRAYISSFSAGTLVWNTSNRQFVRGTDNPVCARTAEGACRGAFDAATDAQGNVYQTFFGSARRGVKPWVFKFRAGSYELTDSIATGQGFYGPTAIRIQRF